MSNFLTPEEAGITTDAPKYNSQRISLDNFLTELQAPREQFGPPEGDKPSPHNLPDFANDSDATFTPPPLPGSAAAGAPGEDSPEHRRRQAKYTAKFVVSTIDTGIGNGCKLLAKAKSAKPYQATPDEKSDLEEVWAEYLAEVGGDIPPGILVLMVSLVVYSPKLIQAFADKKLAQQISEQEKELKDLKDEMKELKLAKEKKTA